METSPYGAPTPGDPASHQPTDTIRLWKALDGLVGYGLSRDVILFMSKLGVAGVHRMLDVFEQEGREAVDGLLSSLEGVSEGTLRNWLDAIADKKSDSGGGRQHSQLASRGTIDSKNDATLTPATPHLLPPSFRRGSSTRTRSASPSASTNLTHPSSQKRLKVTPKTTRKQLYCPDCGTAIKNGFEKHFHKHLPYLFPQTTLGESDLIGCGYCLCNDPELDQGKAFQGVSALLRHIHEDHTQADSLAPARLQWDFNSSFKNVLSGEVNIRRHFLSLVKEENRRIANKTPPYNVPPTLSWLQSQDTRRLLDEMQTLGGSIVGVPFTHLRQEDEFQLKSLLMRAYEAAHKWQPSTVLMGAMPQRLAPARSPQQQLQQTRSVPPPPQAEYYASQDALSFTAMGQGAFDSSQYPSFEDDRATIRPTGFPRTAPYPQKFENNDDGSEATRYLGNPSNPTHALSTPARGQHPNLDTFSGILDALDVDESDLFEKYTTGL